MPYFAMKLVEGGSLADHLDRFRDDPNASADLIAAAAEAVHYAHQHGFLHRDLKPANILLGPRGEPFVSDFGLAKRFGGADLPPDLAELTRTGALVGTPSYMAPEQASGQKGAVSTATDVYGLGAILYELLTGRPPFREPTLAETIRKAAQDEPPRPGTIKPGVNRDLETICLKCLEKDPARRYGSARELADDLRRFRSGEPIHARPVRTPEYLWRWCRRRPAVAGSAALFMLTVAVGFALVVWQWQRAEEQARVARTSAEVADRERERTRAEKDRAEANFRQTRELVHVLCQRFCAGELLHVPGLELVRRQVLEEALRHYQQLAAQRADDPDVRRELADIYALLGLATSATGAQAQALAFYQESLEIYRQLHRQDPGDKALGAKFANVKHNVGSMQLDLGQFQAALASFEDAERLYRQVLERAPQDADLLGGLAEALADRGKLHRRAGRLAEALAALEGARALQENLVKQAPKDPRFRAALASTRNAIGAVQNDLPGSSETALASLRAAQELRRELADQYPQRAWHQRELAESYHNIGITLRRAGRRQEALDALAKERNILEKLVAENPSVALYLRDLAGNHMSIGVTEANLGKNAQAIASFRRAAVLQERLLRDNPGVTHHHADLARSYFNIGVSQTSLGQKAEAIEAYQRSRDLLQKLVNAQPDDIEWRNQLGGTLSNLGILLAQRGRLDDGAQFLREAVRHQRVAFERAPHVTKYRRALGLHYFSLGEVYRAASRLTESVASIQEWQKLWPDDAAEQYAAARQLAFTADRVGNGAAELSERQQSERGKYIDLALAALRRAATKGFRDAGRFDKDPAFQRLREQSEFQAVVKDMRPAP